MNIASDLEKALRGQSAENFHSELSGVDAEDARVGKRLCKCFGRMMMRPGGSISEQCSGWAEVKGFYRLLDQPKLDNEAILRGHRQKTLERAQGGGGKVFLAVQDTTTVNFTSHDALEGKGSIGATAKGSTSGFFIHSTLMLGAEENRVYGLLGSKLYARPVDRNKGKKPGARNREPIEQKESHRWLESFEMAREARAHLAQNDEPVEVINVGDREADIYELICLAQESRDAGMGLLVRSQHNREQDEEEGRIWDRLSAGEVKATFEVSVPRKRGIRSRSVPVQLRYCEVDIAAPAHKKKYLGKSESARVRLLEVRSVDSAEKICWRLLTTVPVEDVEQARSIVGWYAQRWTIEVYHRVLKSGCKVERWQLRDAHRMLTAIAMDMVVAARLMGMLSTARNAPETPASLYLSPPECSALCRFFHKRRLRPETLTTGQAVTLIAQLGGFLARKGDGDPGPQVLWRGVRKLQTIAEVFESIDSEDVGNG